MDDTSADRKKLKRISDDSTIRVSGIDELKAQRTNISQIGGRRTRVSMYKTLTYITITLIIFFLLNVELMR